MSKTLLFLESYSLGDTVGTLPYIEKFVQTNPEDEIIVQIQDWLIPFFENVYPSVNFVGKNEIISHDKLLSLGYLFDKSLQQGYAQQLGFFDAPYIKPKISFTKKQRTIKGKYVTIGVHSTSQLKYWNHPSGRKSQELAPYWNELCGMIRKSGYIPVVVEKDELFGVPPFRNGLPQKANKKVGVSLNDTMNLIDHSEFFIGLSSGLSWIAHAMGKKVAMISNFTEDWNEFDLNSDDYIRITNKNSCHGCFNKIGKDFLYDATDWYWCPLHKDTSREFECHKTITPEMVFNQIKKWLL
jgi:autotransporter strand-loop-strand O-heptosyltransferase